MRLKIACLGQAETKGCKRRAESVDKLKAGYSLDANLFQMKLSCFGYTQGVSLSTVVVVLEGVLQSCRECLFKRYITGVSK